MSSASALFRPYRGLGLISADIPFVVKYKPHSREYCIAVPVGERFNVYQLPNLKLVGMGDCLPSDITSFTSDRSYAYASCGNVIYAFRGLRHISFKLEGHTSPIRKIFAFGDNYLASHDASGTFIVWNLSTRESVSQTVFSDNIFNISAMCHPTGYGDKLLLGSLQGPLQLWKTLLKKPVYWFKGFDSSVTCIVQAPSVDVCAIGLGNGHIILHNIRYDLSLISVAQTGGAITSIDFRSGTVGLGASDALRSAGIANIVEPTASIYLLAGSQSGKLSIWELEDGGTCRGVNQVDDFHLGRVTQLFCLPSGDAAGALVSNGADNCVKVSFFERPDSAPQTRHIRSGHFLPPNKIMFWTGGSAGGSLLISGGPDSQLRIFSTYNERYDRSMGRAYSPTMPPKKYTSVAKRLPFLLPGPAAIALSPGRAHDWDSVAVVHTNRREVSTWNFVKATRGRHWLDPKRFHGKGGDALRVHKHTIATCLCMTRCGHFVVIGYSSGDVVKFNIQSGLEYGGFGDDGKAHETGIVGVHVTSVNRLLITVGESEVKFWNFSTREPLGDALLLDSSPRFSKFHDDSDVLALALSAGEVVLVNVWRRQIFRRFPNPAAHPCTDLALSSDGTLMVTAHRGDPLIKTWDVVDCRLVDCFRVRQPATSVAFSPADDLLATTHAACLGVYLWDNRATYQRLHLKPLPADFTPPKSLDSVDLPTKGLSARPYDFDGEEGEDYEDSDVDNEEHHEEAQSSVYVSPSQLQDKLATLSGLPSSFFTSFLQLDAIKKRNAEATKVTDDTGPPQLPFFLPAIETATGMAWLDDEEEERGGESKGPEEESTTETGSRKRKRRNRELAMEELMLDPGSSVLGSLLGTGASMNPLSDETCDQVMSRLRHLTPSALDAELRLLAPSREELIEAFAAMDPGAGGEAVSLSANPYARLSAFLRLLLNRFRRNLDIDLATACLESLLRFHGDLIARPPKAPASSQAGFDLDAHSSASASSFGLGDMVAAEVVRYNAYLDAGRPLELMEAVLEAKRVSHAVLDMQVSRSIALIDFVRNATTALQM